MSHYDIAIVGGGIVGATAALALAKNTALKIALIDSQLTPTLANARGSESVKAGSQPHRVSAISLTSKIIFENLNVWQKIISQQVSPFVAMHVWEEKNNAKLDFNSADVHSRELGFIVEDSVVRASLYETLKSYESIDFLCPLVLTRLEESPDRITLITADQKTLAAKLLIAADGANSWVRTQAGIELRTWDYEHTALVCTVKTEYPHQKIARQCFLNSGPLAFLPLANDHTCSIVWSTSHSEAHALLQLDDALFNEKLTTAFMSKLGRVTQASSRFSFPLRMRHARHYAKPRIALVGDAAHTIHPLAGQGVNMGLLDAVCLADIMAHAYSKSRDYTDYSVLRRYERKRKSDNAIMLKSVELLKKLFTTEKKWLCGLRNLGLNFTDNSSFLKNFFVNYASGQQEDLPMLARSK